MEQATAHPSAPTEAEQTIRRMQDKLDVALDQLEAQLLAIAEQRAALRTSGALAAADEALGLLP